MSKCAASVAMAREFERTPPTTSPSMKTRQSTLATTSFLRALRENTMRIILIQGVRAYKNMVCSEHSLHTLF